MPYLVIPFKKALLYMKSQQEILVPKLCVAQHRLNYQDLSTTSVGLRG